MAKAPKRGGGSGRRKPRTIGGTPGGDKPENGNKPKDGEKPPAAKPVAKPVRPAAAKPIKPPAAQPVTPPTARPVKPAAAQPVKPAAAQPVKPAVAKPVKPPVRHPIDQPVRPPTARPVKPITAQPVKPPTAKPITAKPVKPPTAKPITAKPVKPPTAKPITAQPIKKPAVARPAVAKPVVAQPAQVASGGASRSAGRAREEVVGARGRQPVARGMGIGAKAGLITALITLIATGATVWLTASDTGDSDAELNRYGYVAATALGGGDTNWWKGASTKTKSTRGVKYVRSSFGKLFGEKGVEWWDAQHSELTSAPNRDNYSPREFEELKARGKKYNEAREKLNGGDAKSSSAGGDMKGRLSTVYNRLLTLKNDQFKVMAAWIGEPIRGGTRGKVLASSSQPSQIAYTDSEYTSTGNGRGYVDGTIGGTKVRIFTAPVGSASVGKRLMGYVGVWQDKSGGSSGMGLGLLMLVLAPLLTGLAAFTVANNHTKNMRALSRDIDRLGSSGDPARQIRAQGQEASLLARSVERMVSNIEFRSAHSGEDLDEIVSREQKVAEEIHGALMSKNPPRLDNYEVETLFKPGFEIGGDHFEYFRIDDDHMGIILLDTNVRGVPAALVMAQAKAYVRMMAPDTLSPAEVLRKINDALTGELPSGRYVTALYAVLNTAEGTATIASAGHLPLLVYRHATGKVAKVNPEGLALGLDTGPVFDQALQEGDIPIGVGDRIVLYTDGALKVQSAEGDEYGETRFYQTVLREAPKNSQAFVNFVGSAIDQFHLEAPQNDDITISTVKRLR